MGKIGAPVLRERIAGPGGVEGCLAEKEDGDASAPLLFIRDQVENLISMETVQRFLDRCCNRFGRKGFLAQLLLIGI